ncbi:MAG: DUF2029 domain-containing protein [Nocardioidaceae bacterium]|nr:DUF2029 domain-containing protein [Nocardioidaceae bacterium]
MRLAALAVIWLATRAWMLWLLHHSQEWVTGDVGYYFASVHALGDAGLDHTLVEYPVPGVWALAVPYVVASVLGDPAQYQNLLFGLGLATDLGFAVLLWWSARGRSLLPATVWVLGVPLLGVTALARFDLLPGVLVGVAVLLLGRRPAASGVVLALAAGAKLWPVVLVPALLGVARTRRRVLVAVGATGLVLAVASLVAAGPARLFSPLAYQADRGLQIESVPATPVVAAWSLVRGGWQVVFAASRSYEITGPGVSALVAVSTFAAAAYVVGLLAAWSGLLVLARRGVDVDTRTTVWLLLASVTGYVVVSKVLSPQYLLWVLPVAAAGLVVADHRALRLWTAGLLVAMLLTQVVFPWGYTDIVNGIGPLPLYGAALAGRNALLLGLVVAAGLQVWWGLREAGLPAPGFGQSASIQSTL